MNRRGFRTAQARWLMRAGRTQAASPDPVLILDSSMVVEDRSGRQVLRVAGEGAGDHGRRRARTYMSREPQGPFEAERAFRMPTDMFEPKVVPADSKTADATAANATAADRTTDDAATPVARDAESPGADGGYVRVPLAWRRWSWIRAAPQMVMSAQAIEALMAPAATAAAAASVEALLRRLSQERLTATPAVTVGVSDHRGGGPRGTATFPQGLARPASAVDGRASRPGGDHPADRTNGIYDPHNAAARAQSLRATDVSRRIRAWTQGSELSTTMTSASPAERRTDRVRARREAPVAAHRAVMPNRSIAAVDNGLCRARGTGSAHPVRRMQPSESRPITILHFQDIGVGRKSASSTADHHGGAGHRCFSHRQSSRQPKFSSGTRMPLTPRPIRICRTGNEGALGRGLSHSSRSIVQQNTDRRLDQCMVAAPASSVETWRAPGEPYLPCAMRVWRAVSASRLPLRRSRIDDQHVSWGLPDAADDPRRHLTFRSCRSSASCRVGIRKIDRCP